MLNSDCKNVNSPSSPLQISYEDFQCRARNAGCRTLSVHYRPCQDETASIFSTSVGTLLSEETYSVKSANAARTSFTNYDDTNARALRFDELVKTTSLLEQVLRECSDFAGRQITEASVISLRCSGCRRRIIVDGVHRLTRLASEGRIHVPVNVVELTGRNWPLDTPDFNVVCVCPRK